MKAGDFLQDSLEISHFYNDKYDKMCCLSRDVQKAIQEYARLKCGELLEILAEKAEIKTVTIPSGLNIKICVVDKDSIFNAVDLDEFVK